MGSLCCAADDCTVELKNHRSGAFCAYHESLHGSKCHMRDCPNAKVSPTQACEEHGEHMFVLIAMQIYLV